MPRKKLFSAIAGKVRETQHSRMLARGTHTAGPWAKSCGRHGREEGQDTIRVHPSPSSLYKWHCKSWLTVGVTESVATKAQPEPFYTAKSPRVRPQPTLQVAFSLSGPSWS